jgi:CBS domain-containing protein
MIISDVLHTKGHEVTTVQQTDIVAAVVRVLADRHIGAVVVQDRWQKLVGIFSERDLVNALAREGAAALGREVAELMSKPVITCTGSDRIDGVLARMTLNRVRHLPVLEGGALAGIVSIGDLVGHRLDEKEREAGVLLDISRLRS